MKSLIFIHELFAIIMSVCQITGLVAQPADLGTFGTHNDLQNGISTYPLQAEERMPSEFFKLAFINYTYVDNEGRERRFAEEKAKYGEGRVLNVHGYIVHVTGKDIEDHTACKEPILGTKGGALPAHGTPWIALIKRGDCNFVTKVQHAYNNRAVGVIIYNDRDSLTLDRMKIDKEFGKYNSICIILSVVELHTFLLSFFTSFQFFVFSFRFSKRTNH